MKYAVLYLKDLKSLFKLVKPVEPQPEHSEQALNI